MFEVRYRGNGRWNVGDLSQSGNWLPIASFRTEEQATELAADLNRNVPEYPKQKVPTTQTEPTQTDHRQKEDRSDVQSPT